MMAADNFELHSVNENNTLSAVKKLKRDKRHADTSVSNGHLGNGNGSSPEVHQTLSPKLSETKSNGEATLEISSDSQRSARKLSEPSESLETNLTPLVSAQSGAKPREDPSKFSAIILTTVEDEDDDEQRVERKKIRPLDGIITDSENRPSIMVQSITSAGGGGGGGDNDVIEIHEFTLADLDAYLDIYFETLNNRLRHYIGDGEQLQQFRNELRTRISSNENSREFQNVLLGKVHEDIVAAVTLSFPGERVTILEDNLLPEASSCLTSMRRWMIRNANYIPTNMEECYIEMIGVKSACRNHGIGTAMLECVEHFAQQAGATALTVHANTDRLRTYFQRFGFQTDASDNTAFWKWAVEHEVVHKMTKAISSPDGRAVDNESSYINESMTESDL